MIVAHKIALDPNAEQRIHLARAAGTARFAYNWALAEWLRQHKAGEKPSIAKLRAQWSLVRRTQFPWTLEVTKCASTQAIRNLGSAFSNFFRDLKKPKGSKKAKYPKFKKKGKNDSFALWNDQFEIRFGLCETRSEIWIPLLGWVRMRENLRLGGKIMGAVVSRTADRWYVSIQCQVPDPVQAHPQPGTVVGVDVGVSCLMALSKPLADGTTRIENPRPLKKAMRRIRKLSRGISRQENVRRKTAAKTSRRAKVRRTRLSRLHQHVANVRLDAIHKATTRITRAFETIVLEDLNVSGMTKNHSLAGAISDSAFATIRRFCEYKAYEQGGTVELADRFYPSSKTCSVCKTVVKKLVCEKDRTWTCKVCDTRHDRDDNAATNLENLKVGQAILPEPSLGAPATTPGEIAALAFSQEKVKLRSVNRELTRSHLSTS